MGPTACPRPCRGSHPPDSRGAEGGRGARRDVRVVLGDELVLNSVLTRKDTDVSSAAHRTRDGGDPGKKMGRSSQEAKTMARFVSARAPPCCRAVLGARGLLGEGRVQGVPAGLLFKGSLKKLH